MATVKIAQASIDERGSARGGEAGDQKVYMGKKGETNISDWYARSNGRWDEIIRCKDESIAKKAADLIVKATNSHLIGYDQGERNTFFQALKKNNWNLDKYIASGEKTETDCSAYVYAIYCILIPSLRNGLEEGRVSGRGNSPACQTVWTTFNRYGNGMFDRYDDYNMCNTNSHLKVGDLLNCREHHIVMIVSTEGTVPVDIPPSNEYIASASSRGSSYSSSSGLTSNISGASNTVSRLAARKRENENILKQDDARKGEFESMVNAMASAAPKMGRDILMTGELYDSNILKGNQESRKERV
jgi:hypothetical protein